MIIVQITFIIFFKVLLRTREMHFEEPWLKFFAKRRLLSLRYRKGSNNYSLVFSPKKTSKRSAAPAPRLQFQESWQKNSRQKSNNFAQRPKNLSRVIHSEDTFKNCSVEHRECGFDIAASNFCLIVQTFLLQVRKWIEKQFFYKFPPLIFFCNIRLLLCHPDFFQQTKELLKLQNRWTRITLF